MNLKKFVKDKQNTYKVTIDDEDYLLYDDVIIKYQLINKKEISSDVFKDIISENDELKSYYDSIKYITKKLRSEKEIREYLQKKEISNSIINKTINKLKEKNFLNEDIYLKSYINDQINLTNNGPQKIKSNLIKLGFDEEKILEYLNKIDKSIFDEKINKYIDKKIRSNHASSSYMLKIKINNDLINLGFLKEDIINILEKYDILDEDILKVEREKARKALEKKYSGYELEQKIKARLYRKGFNINKIDGDMYEE